MDEHELQFIQSKIEALLFAYGEVLDAKRIAKKLGVYGQVENLDNGKVRVEAEGEEEDIKKFEEELNSGSALSRIKAISCEQSDKLSGFSDFNVIYKNFFDRP